MCFNNTTRKKQDQGFLIFFRLIKQNKRLRKMKKTKEQLKKISQYIEYRRNPISDIKDFNQFLKECEIIKKNQFVKRETLRSLLK